MRPRSSSLLTSVQARGFSLVELLVALVFTSILMAGLASVFRGSMSAFVTTGEKLSSGRRNRMSVDMIYDDLNAAGMLLTSLAGYTGTSANPITLNTLNPAFRITPNAPYVGTDVAAPNNVTDQLDLYFDEALPFEGTVGGAGSPGVVEYMGQALPGSTTRTIDLGDADQAALVVEEHARSPITVLLRANVNQLITPSSLTVTGKQVTVNTTTDLMAETGSTSNLSIPGGTAAMFVKPGRYVRYSIRSQNLDPNPANAGTRVPCLMRDEVLYNAVAGNPTPFAAPINSTIVAENVIGFQVMVSPDGGNTWANDPNDAAQRAGGVPTPAVPGLSHTTFGTWAAIAARLNASAAINARPGPNNSVNDGRFWFKDIPVTIRVDITTRTARPRSEYLQNLPNTIINETGGIAPYKIQTQSVVLVPRHFGLSYGAYLL
jgi:type II secretory pathway pseudopilin PulG